MDTRETSIMNLHTEDGPQSRDADQERKLLGDENLTTSTIHVTTDCSYTIISVTASAMMDENEALCVKTEDESEPTGEIEIMNRPSLEELSQTHNIAPDIQDNRYDAESIPCVSQWHPYEQTLERTASESTVVVETTRTTDNESITDNNEKCATRKSQQTICPKCEKPCKERRALRRHMKRHKSEKRWSCNVCEQQLANSKSLKRHLYFFHGQQEKSRFKCTKCDKCFWWRYELDNHWKRRHEKTTPVLPFKCSECPKAFELKSSLSKHIERVHRGVRNFHCTCGKKFKTKGELSLHQKVHTWNNSVKCEVCGVILKQKSHLKAHMRTHTSERPYSCQICGKRFRWPNNLKEHRLVHDFSDDFPCKKCGKKFKSQFILNTHMNYSHSEERNFKCTICAKGFKSRSDCKRHEHTHNKATVSCDICGKKLKTKGNLIKHQQNVHFHSEKREYKCHLCDKSYKGISGLRTHAKVHDKSSWISCAECGTFFKTKGELKSHQLVHTREQNFACTFCGKKFSFFKPEKARENCAQVRVNIRWTI